MLGSHTFNQATKNAIIKKANNLTRKTNLQRREVINAHVERHSTSLVIREIGSCEKSHTFRLFPIKFLNSEDKI